MVRLLCDENFNGDVVRGVTLLKSDVDIVRVQDVGLDGEADPEILAWAAENDRIVLTHDRATMPDFAYERLRRGESMPGLFVFNDRHPVRDMIDEVVLIHEASDHQEWHGCVLHLPL